MLCVDWPKFSISLISLSNKYRQSGVHVCVGIFLNFFSLSVCIKLITISLHTTAICYIINIVQFNSKCRDIGCCPSLVLDYQNLTVPE